MRRRFMVSISLFGLGLSLLFAFAVLGIFYWIEDQTYRQQLEQLMEGEGLEVASSSFSGWESGLPPFIVSESSQLPEGHHEIEEGGKETHLLIESRGDSGRRRVAMIQVRETPASERTLFVSLGLAILFTSVAGLLLGTLLARHVLRPVESLVAWLGSSDRVTSPPPKSPNEEIQVLTNALGEYVHERESRLNRERAFVGEASHELRTPVSVIRGVCELAEHTPFTDELLNRVRRSVGRMEHTVEGLLCLTKEEQRIEGVQFDEEWRSLIDEAEERFENRATLDVELTGAPEDPLAGRMVILALGALLDNIHEHSGASEIRVSLDKDRLTVGDNGKGIAELPEIQHSLRKGHPLPHGGMGLALVERICRRMEWKFELENDDGARALVSF